MAPKVVKSPQGACGLPLATSGLGLNDNRGKFASFSGGCQDAVSRNFFRWGHYETRTPGIIGDTNMRTTLCLVAVGALLLVCPVSVKSIQPNALELVASKSEHSGTKGSHANMGVASPRDTLTSDDKTKKAPEQVPDFIPTDEWQEILPGQHIPPGLWVRLDMSTGGYFNCCAYIRYDDLQDPRLSF